MRICLLFCIFFAGCATRNKTQWHTYDAGPFTFSLPPGFYKTSDSGIDSYVSKFEGRNMTVSFDFGLYSGNPLDSLREDPNTLQPRPSFVSHVETIIGHQVQIVSVDFDPNHNSGFRCFIAASFLNAGLTMTARCKSVGDYEGAKRIFRSVSFKQR